MSKRILTCKTFSIFDENIKNINETFDDYVRMYNPSRHNDMCYAVIIADDNRFEGL